MAYSVENHKVGDKVWVYAFYRLSGHEGHFHNIKPSYGIIVGSHGIEGIEQDIGSERCWNIALYKTKKGKVTDELSNKTISLLKVQIADSYDEAVAEYNKLVNNEVYFYRSKLEQVESYLIT